MACVALTSLMATIHLELLQPIPRVSLHDDAAIKFLNETLSSLQDFLQKESSRGAAIKDLETKIRDFALKAEDHIEIQLGNLLLAKDREDQEKASQELQQTLQEAAENAAELMIISNTSDEADKAKGKEYQEEASRELRQTLCEAAENAVELLKIIHSTSNEADEAKGKEYQEEASQELRQTLCEAAENAVELLKIIHSTSNEADEPNETQSSVRWLKHAPESENVMSDGSLRHSPKLKDRMVGRRHDLKAIKDRLFRGSFGLLLIPIVGMVGIGKTTLARSVYEDPSVERYFGVRGWITLPQEYNKSQMLCDLLQSIGLAKPKCTPDELTELVRKFLMGRRYLIVLDNFWNSRALKDIQRCFPDHADGSRILLTTRHFYRISYAGSYIRYIHNMTLLDPNESWELFCNIFSLKEYMAPKFEKIRSHILEKCDGLPQLIIAVAERLSKCNNIQQQWKKIEKEVESLGILDRSLFTLSYNQLPQHLKVCFLYLGVFPKRSEILVKMLIRLWIAEGFVKPLEHKELENQAYEYLQELICRSLLLIGTWNSNRKIKTCRMHSALHSFCVGEAQKEGIFCAVNTLQHPGLSLNKFANSCRWFSLCTHSFDYYVVFSTNIPRSILFFHECPEMFVPFKLSRVLAFVPSSFLQRVPIHLGDLVFLRYLSIPQWFEGLDCIVSTNPNLQTLIVSGIQSQPGVTPLRLPSIWELPRLRHLELGNSYTVVPPIMVRENLRALSWVSPTHCRKGVYFMFPNINKLKIFYKDELDGYCGNPITLDYLDYLNRLEKLTVSASVGCDVTLPEQSVFPLQLKKLRLSGINLSRWDLMVISMLPRLKVLKLEGAFHGKVWKVAKAGFCELRFLLLEDKKLEQWMVDKYSFPCLKHLVLRFCYCLEEIPRDIAYSFTLQTIELERCRRSVVASAEQIQEALQNFGYGTIEIKRRGPEYDESQYAHIKEFVKDNLAGLTVN